MARNVGWLGRASGAVGQAIYEFRLPFRRAKYGQVLTSRGSWYVEKGKNYKVPEDRLKKYEMAYDYFIEHEFARPIINLQASAIFGKGMDFIGDDDLVAFARALFNKSDLFQFAIEGGIYGDNFIRIFGDKGEVPRIALIPPDTITIDVNPDNANDVTKYMQYENSQTMDGEDIPPEQMEHIMFNAVSNSLFGNSDLVHLFYWFDMYDSLTEGADKRRIFSSNPIGVYTGIETRHRQTIKTMLADVDRDVDQKEGLRSSLPPGSQLLLPKGVDYKVAGAEGLGLFNLEEMMERVMMVVAAASETPLHYLSVGTNINLGTSKEMKWPFVKKIQRRQQLYKKGFESILKKALGNQAGIENEEELDIKIVFPPIYDYDLEQVEAMLKAVLLVNQSGKLSDETTVNLVCNYLGVDIEKENERINIEADEKEEEEETTADRAAAEIGKAVASGEIEKEKATEMISKIVRD